MKQTSKRSRLSTWTAEEEQKLKIKFLREDLAAYHVDELKILECGDDRSKLEALLAEVKRKSLLCIVVYIVFHPVQNPCWQSPFFSFTQSH